MKQRVPVSEIMTKNLVTLNLNDNLTDAEHLFKKHHIRHIPVIKGRHIEGMLSYTDLLRISFADATDEEGEEVETTIYNMFTIHQVMTKNIVTIPSHTNVKEAAELFVSKEFHALPVVEGENLVGIVTTTDIINYFLKQY